MCEIKIRRTKSQYNININNNNNDLLGNGYKSNYRTNYNVGGCFLNYPPLTEFIVKISHCLALERFRFNNTCL